MRILHLLNELRPSGMERMLVAAAERFADHGIETVVLGQGDYHPYARQLRAAGFVVEELPLIKTRKGAQAFMGAVKASVPDVVHLHSEWSYPVAVPLVKISAPRVPIVRTIHNVFKPQGARRKIVRDIQPYVVDPFVAELIAVSPDVQENERASGRSTKVIFNWVEDRFLRLRQARQELAPKGNRLSVVMVGNAGYAKNHELLLDAIAPLPIDLYFHGDERDATSAERSLLGTLEAQGRLRHRGVSDPFDSLARASLFAMPSRHEGMPVSLAEALVGGVPAIISDAPGLKWAAGLPGVTVLPSSAVLDWRRHFEELVASPPERVVPGLPIDFSSSRGADEYVLAWQAATVRTARWRRNCARD